MRRACLRIAASLLATMLACCLLGCEFLGFKYVEYPEEEDGKQQIEVDRSEAEPHLEAYLQEKYGLSEGDCTVSDLAPWTRDSTIDISPGSGNGPYYQGQWQARIDTDGGEFYARVAVSGGEASFDTRQAAEYYSDLEAWIRERLDLPEQCDLYINVDEIDNIIPATKNRVEEVLAFFLVKERYRTLTGYYDGENVFSPIEKNIEIHIFYPDGYSSGDYRAADEISQAFPEQITGDISLSIRQKSPKNLEQNWYRASSADSADGSGDGAS